MPAAKRAAQRKAPRRQPGRRGYLGTTDFLCGERQAVGAWGRCEEEKGHSVSKSDLFAAFQCLVATTVSRLRDLQQQSGTLSDFDSRRLKFGEARLTVWAKGGRQLEKAKNKLLDQTGFRLRVTARMTHLSTGEERRRVQTAWRFFDHALWQIAYGTSQSLQPLVQNPWETSTRRGQTVIVLTDQVPVWLKVKADRVLVSEELLAVRGAEKKRRQSRREQPGGVIAELGDEQPDQYTKVSGPGSSGDSRWRVTLVCRQEVHDYFQPDAVPKGLSMSSGPWRWWWLYSQCSKPPYRIVVVVVIVVVVGVWY